MNTTTDQQDLVHEALFGAGFQTSDYLDDPHALQLTSRERGVLDYFRQRTSFDAFRIGDTPFGDSTWATLARLDEEGLHLRAIDENGVITSEVSFDLTPMGLGLAVAAMEVFA